MNSLSTFLPVLSIAISVMVVLGGYYAFRQGFFKQSSEIQEQTINALNTRLNTLEKQAESDAKEIARLRQLINTIRHALKRRGLHIEIEGDYVTLIDAEGQRMSTQPPAVAKVAQPTPSRLTRPVKLQPIPEDDTAS